MLKTLTYHKQYIIYDDNLINADVERSFDVQFWQADNKVIGSAQGRGTTWFLQLTKLQGALRHYRRGGLFGKIVADHYIFTGWEKSRSVAEFHLLHTLRTAGVNVPQPIAARVRKCIFTYQADLLSEKIPDAQDLVSILQQRELTDGEYRAIALQVKAMHQAQVNHTDLNIHNILLDGQGKVWLIDFDKCYVQAGSSWKANNLARLLRSFNKERNKRHIKWQSADWQTFMTAYQTSCSA